MLIVTCFFANTKVTQKGWIPSEEFSLNFGHTVLVLADTNNIGYKDQVVKATGENITVNLKEDAGLLDEVVVTGYGTQKKASLTSAISQIKGDEVFKDRAVSSTTVALQGEIPGLTVTRSSTRPGSEGASMQIRGDISVNGSASPLIIIDGIVGSMDEFNSINGDDIDNISVLKDASAAIYGSRAAAGVILVTTKRGKQGKAQIKYDGSISRTINGIQPPIRASSSGAWATRRNIFPTSMPPTIGSSVRTTAALYSLSRQPSKDVPLTSSARCTTRLTPASGTLRTRSSPNRSSSVSITIRWATPAATSPTIGN